MKAYITDYIDNPTIEKEILGDNLGESLDRSELEVLIVWHDHIDAEYIDSCPKLKGIVRYGVGYDNVDYQHAAKKGIFVCNTPDYGTEEVSDTALAMILNIARGVSQYDYNCRNYSETWQENTLEKLKRTNQCLLGVIGAGRIGGSILLKAKALGFKTAFYDPFVVSGHDKLLGAKQYFERSDLLAEADIISINCPLNDETRGMVDESFIQAMKTGSSLVNTSRGFLVKDLDVFFEPLKENKLECVALDVLPEEPPKDSALINSWRKREDWLGGRLIINPHSAYYSVQAFREMREKVATNALRILKGQRPLNVINGL
ncbi:MAG: C-terminal binding protein [Halobacteriovoraceae bacterium]|nr:C-terminal binding protein [Halobacteriovoraceae bacterium]